MIVYYLIIALHILVCLILILVVLLQSGKGADLAGAFGGGGTQTAFGSRGPASFLSKLTTISAIVFMCTCLALSLMGTRTQSRSILDTTKGSSAPAAKPPAVQQQAPAPSPDEIKKKQLEIEEKQKQNPPAVKTPSAPVPAPSSGTKTAPAKETKPADAGKKP